MDRIGTLLGRVAVLSDDELQELEDLVLEEFHAVGSDPTKAMGVTEAETLESLAAAGRPSRQRSVARGRRRTSQELPLDEPRTDESRRTVPFPRSAIETLRAHRIRLVFTTEIGTPLEPRNVLRRFEVLCERAGLRRVTLHTLRRSATCFLLAAGTHTVVQEHLGHSSYAITADIYSHVGPAQQWEAADRLDQALRW